MGGARATDVRPRSPQVPGWTTIRSRKITIRTSQLGVHEVERLTERLRPLGLHPRHFGLLTHIATAAGQSQQALSGALGVHRTAMVALVDDLEARGLVERRRDPRDRRAYALHLTRAAAELLADAERAVDAHEAELLASLD